jgi:hypothetical protein
LADAQLIPRINIANNPIATTVDFLVFIIQVFSFTSSITPIL